MRVNFFAGILGNILEHYDLAVFSLLAPFIAPLFFPSSDPITAMVYTYGMLALGAFAKPIGSFVFGRIGSCHGRKLALTSSLSGLACVTGLMGCLPTYDQVGYWAPLFLAMGRILQSFFVGGETAGGAIFILEHTHESKHCLMSSLYGSSSIVGITIASALITLLSWMGDITTLWRIPFLIGFATAVGSLLVRSKAQEPPGFVPRDPLAEPILPLLKAHWRPLLAIMAVGGFSTANYTLALILPNGFLPKVASITQAEVMSLNSILLLGDMVTLPLFGWLSNKITPKRSMALAAACSVCLAIPLYGLFEQATWAQIVIIRAVLVALGVWFSAPLHAWIQTLAPMHSRFFLISIGYAIGSKLIGSPAIVLSLWIYKETGLVAAPGIYWAVAALFAVVTIYMQGVPARSASLQPSRASSSERVSAAL